MSLNVNVISQVLHACLILVTFIIYYYYLYALSNKMTYDTNQLTHASAINMSIRRLLMEVATF